MDDTNDAAEESMDDGRATYGEGYEDYTSDVNARTGTFLTFYTNIL